METIHVLNPAAGKGAALEFSKHDNTYVTKCQGDACQYIKQKLNLDPTLNFAVYGGDGTVNEAVEGIVSTAPDTASLTVVPTGTGNDLARTIDELGIHNPQIDVLTLNDGYAVNAVNTGFDLSVVLETAKLKKIPFVSGSLAYVLGIVTALFKRYGRYMHITYTDKDDNVHEYEGDCLLCVAANGKYYGGGFKCAPTADITDGLVDLMIVKKVPRIKFLTLVGAYRKGTHIDVSTDQPYKRFEKILTFCKCKHVIMDGIEQICADGEVTPATRAEISVLPKTLKIVNNR